MFLDEFLGDADLSSVLGSPAPAGRDDPAVRRARALLRTACSSATATTRWRNWAAPTWPAKGSPTSRPSTWRTRRIGIAPLEKSTRYVRFDRRDAKGRRLFFVEPTIAGSKHAQDYHELMELLFDTYERQMEPMIAPRAQIASVGGNRAPQTLGPAPPSRMPRPGGTRRSPSGQRPPTAPPSGPTPATSCAATCPRRPGPTSGCSG